MPREWNHVVHELREEEIAYAKNLRAIEELYSSFLSRCDDVSPVYCVAVILDCVQELQRLSSHLMGHLVESLFLDNVILFCATEFRYLYPMCISNIREAADRLYREVPSTSRVQLDDSDLRLLRDDDHPLKLLLTHLRRLKECTTQLYHADIKPGRIRFRTSLDAAIPVLETAEKAIIAESVRLHGSKEVMVWHRYQLSLRETHGAPEESDAEGEALILTLIATEADYIRDLQLIEELFIQPLRSSDFLVVQPTERPAFLRTVFCNVSGLHSTHQQFFHSLLELQCEQYPLTSVRTVAGYLQGCVSLLGGAYATYIKNYPTALSRLVEEVEESSSLRDFVRHATMYPDTRGRDIYDFVYRPIGRLLEYETSIKDILFTVRSSHGTRDIESLERLVKALGALRASQPRSTWAEELHDGESLSSTDFYEDTWDPPPPFHETILPEEVTITETWEVQDMARILINSGGDPSAGMQSSIISNISLARRTVNIPVRRPLLLETAPALSHEPPAPWHNPLRPLLPQRPSLTTITTFYTADEHRSLSVPKTQLEDDRISLHTVTTFYSIEDPALLRLNNEHDFRVLFRNSDLDLTASLRILPAAGSGTGGNADVVQGMLRRAFSQPQRVAVKIVRKSYSDTSAHIHRLAREIGIWKTLSHPCVLPLTGLYWNLSNLPAMVSPWCQNGNAFEYIRARQSQPDIQNLRLKLLRDTLDGLAYLHGIAVIHGDIKGANILVCDDGHACLGDFGVSAVIFEHPSHSATGTGTYRWMAPDLFKDHAALTRQTDMWAIGCVILELTGLRMPFWNIQEEYRVIIALHSNQIPPRPPGVADDLWVLSLQCFALEPELRPSAEKLALQLPPQHTLLDELMISENINSKLSKSSVVPSPTPASPVDGQGVIVGIYELDTTDLTSINVPPHIKYTELMDEIQQHLGRQVELVQYRNAKGGLEKLDACNVEDWMYSPDNVLYV